MIYRRKKWVLLVSVIFAGIVVHLLFETPNVRGGGTAMMAGILFLAIIFKATIEYFLGKREKKKRLKQNDVKSMPVSRGEPVKEIISPSGRCKVMILRGRDSIFRLEVHLLEYEDYTMSDHWRSYDAGTLTDSLERAEALALEEIQLISASDRR